MISAAAMLKSRVAMCNRGDILPLFDTQLWKMTADVGRKEKESKERHKILSSTDADVVPYDVPVLYKI